MYHNTPIDDMSTAPKTGETIIVFSKEYGPVPVVWSTVFSKSVGTERKLDAWVTAPSAIGLKEFQVYRETDFTGWYSQVKIR